MKKTFIKNLTKQIGGLSSVAADSMEMVFYLGCRDQGWGDCDLKKKYGCYEMV